MMKIGVNIRNAYLLLKADFLKIFINKDGRVFMSRIIKNVLPYWKSIVLVFALDVYKRQEYILMERR